MTLFSKITRRKARTLRGLSLLEAILALGIGGIVITQSVFGVQEYSEGLRVQASASQVKRLTSAADQYAQDNYSDLLASAPEELSVDVLQPYIGDNIGPDAFNNQYVLSTRTYSVTVPDPAGGTRNQDFLQVMVVGSAANDTEIATEPALRADVANTAGAQAGFMADGNIFESCNGVTVTATDACGAFGSYVIDTSNFTATNFDDATVVSLLTKGDSSMYGDQLYRYDYGDPELNTMSTDLLMDNNDLVNPSEITGLDRLNFDGGPQEIDTTTGDLSLRPANNLAIEAGNGIAVQAGSDGMVFLDSDPAPRAGENPQTADMFRLETGNGRMRLNNDQTVFGDMEDWTHNGTLERTGTGNIWFGEGRAKELRVKDGINSLFAESTDALRIQRNRVSGETIFGQRVRYTPNSDSGTYELSDGDITAQHASVQDITCADCGGSLSHILPRWRQMGTYFIPSGTIARVPKPECGDSRTAMKSRPGVADDDDLAYQENEKDSRYEPKIILTPRQISFGSVSGSNQVDIRYDALDDGDEWLTEVQTDNPGGGAATDASALAQTYCVFIGGETDPAVGMPDMVESGPTFQRIE